jgi:flagellin-like hook-associated protein FlgL
MTGAIGLSFAPAFPAFRLLEKNQELQMERFRQTAKVAKEIDYFKKAAAKVKTVDEFFKDRRLVSFALTAYGLESDLKYLGRVRKVMTENPADPNALQNRLLDPRYKEIAKDFSFFALKVGKLKLNFFVSDVIEKYVQNAFEISLGEQNPALREAAYFRRKIGDVKTAYDILGDAVLRSVATATVGLPPEIARQSIEKQARLIDDKIDIKKFQTAPASASQTAADATTDLANLNKYLSLSKAAVTQAEAFVARIVAIQNDYSAVANNQSLTGPYAAEIPTQQAAVPNLGRQIGLLTAANQAASQINAYHGTLQSIISTAQATGITAQLQSDFANTVTAITNLVSQATFGGENLIDGSIASPITVQIKSTGEGITVRNQNLTSYLSTLSSANTSFQASNVTAASTSFQSARTTFDGVKFQLDADTGIFNTGIASVQRWVPTLTTGNVSLANLTVKQAQTQWGTVNSLVFQIQNIASAATSTTLTAAERTALNSQYNSLRDQLRDAIDNATFSGQNLLNGSSILIGTSTTAGIVDVATGQQVDIDGFDLKRYADDTAPPAESLYNFDLTSAANASTTLTHITGTVNVDVQRAFRVLAADAGAFNLLAETLDPRGKVDTAYRQLATDAATLISNAAVGSLNLIERNTQDQRFTVQSTGRILTVTAQPTFRTLVEDVLKAGSALILTNFTAATQALSDARFDAQRFATALNADRRLLDEQKARVTAIQATEAKANPTSTAVKPTAYTTSFLEKFLILQDAKNATTAGVGGGNAYVLALFSGGSSINLVA